MSSMMINTKSLQFGMASRAFSMYWINWEPAILKPMGTFSYTYVFAPTYGATPVNFWHSFARFNESYAALISKIEMNLAPE